MSRSLPPIVQSKPSSDNLNKSFDSLENNSYDLIDMYPVKKEMFDVLFDGHFKEGKGRYKYLNLRKQIPLEERYQHPVSNSMIYGWKLGETEQKFKTPTYARGKIVEESFYRRNGVF
jgi:hypothetical protein